MNEVDTIRGLAAQASGSAPPDVDPTAGVLAEIARRRRAPLGWMGLMAAASVAAAAVLAALAWHSWAEMVDPINQWFASCDMVLQ